MAKFSFLPQLAIIVTINEQDKEDTKNQLHSQI